MGFDRSSLGFRLRMVRLRVLRGVGLGWEWVGFGFETLGFDGRGLFGL